MNISLEEAAVEVRVMPVHCICWAYSTVSSTTAPMFCFSALECPLPHGDDFNFLRLWESTHLGLSIPARRGTKLCGIKHIYIALSSPPSVPRVHSCLAALRQLYHGAQVWWTVTMALLLVSEGLRSAVAFTATLQQAKGFVTRHLLFSFLRCFHHAGHCIYCALSLGLLEMIIRLLLSRLRWQMALICSLTLPRIHCPGSRWIGSCVSLTVVCWWFSHISSWGIQLSFVFVFLNYYHVCVHSMHVCAWYICVSALTVCVWRPEDSSVELALPLTLTWALGLQLRLPCLCSPWLYLLSHPVGPLDRFFLLDVLSFGNRIV